MYAHSERNKQMNHVSSALHRSRKFVTWSVAAVALAALALTEPGTLRGAAYPFGTNQQGTVPYAIGLWGDLPYSAEQAAVIPKLIADMNSQDLVFTAHDGDLRQGSGSPDCADSSIYTRAAGYFGSLRAPAIFTPGDNDWTDCDRKSLGANGRNSLQELDNERALFFSTPYTLGLSQFLLEVQATPLCKGFGGANGNTGPSSDVTMTQMPHTPTFPASKTAVGLSATSYTRRSTSRAPATTSATITRIPWNTPPAMRRASNG